MTFLVTLHLKSSFENFVSTGLKERKQGTWQDTMDGREIYWGKCLQGITNWNAVLTPEQERGARSLSRKVQTTVQLEERFDQNDESSAQSHLSEETLQSQEKSCLSNFPVGSHWLQADCGKCPSPRKWWWIQSPELRLPMDFTPLTGGVPRVTATTKMRLSYAMVQIRRYSGSVQAFNNMD